MLTYELSRFLSLSFYEHTHIRDIALKRARVNCYQFSFVSEFHGCVGKLPLEFTDTSREGVGQERKRANDNNILFSSIRSLNEYVRVSP